MIWGLVQWRLDSETAVHLRLGTVASGQWDGCASGAWYSGVWTVHIMPMHCLVARTHSEGKGEGGGVMRVITPVCRSGCYPFAGSTPATSNDAYRTMCRLTMCHVPQATYAQLSGTHRPIHENKLSFIPVTL